ncbi:MocR-like pyridoxine biosynthesis transcription factor PdxR [Tenggerimyces flavus]|uniref:PLP-dependent aminotransferase family protein n=1 Tax=Tenggerimyces flavus TaxID=1708749 RepID=A0ABV7YIH0_9ACTN|nr:PLP-dependent aminotransferase family protein [Tenggerimyces flavus]MBM7789321.1 GntR family transcriptional regulator/MocR family aminotransferase [Tenggerimyces flavus]
MADSRTNSRPTGDLLIELRRDVNDPLHRQIAAAIRAGIQARRLRLGMALPPTRQLAATLDVSRGVVVEAYQILVAEGYLTSRSGGYTRVAVGPQPEPATPRAEPTNEASIDFSSCRPDVSRFPRAAWVRSVRRVFNETPSELLGYLPGRGVPQLRVALAEHLNRVRGTNAHPDNIVVCNGYTQGIALLFQVLKWMGAKRIAVEDPTSDDDAVPAARALGLEVVGVPVDEDGIRVDVLARTAANAVVLTPSHQWPTGGVLPPESRAAVLGWAADRGALVIEDDYDAEFRYDRAPIGSMHGLAPELVMYMGTASKTLAPGLRLGWMVLPQNLVDLVAEAKVTADRGTPTTEQLVFADFLARGEFDRHLRRMRPAYRRRRDVLLEALSTYCPMLEPAGVAAGLHLIAWLPDTVDETAVVTEARAQDVKIDGIGTYRLSSKGRGGLIFGYGGQTEAAMTEGVKILGSVIAALAD